jgi:hypothetical protein
MKRIIEIEGVAAMVMGSIIDSPASYVGPYAYRRRVSIRTVNGDEVELHLFSNSMEQLRPNDSGFPGGDGLMFTKADEVIQFHDNGKSDSRKVEG